MNILGNIYLLINSLFLWECSDQKCGPSSSLTVYLATASPAPPSEFLMPLFMQLYTLQLVSIIQHMLCYTDLYLTSGSIIFFSNFKTETKIIMPHSIAFLLLSIRISLFRLRWAFYFLTKTLLQIVDYHRI